MRLPRAPLVLAVLVIASLIPGWVPADAAPARGGDYVVGFDALPHDRARYHGDPVRAVNEALRFLVVHASNADALRAAAARDGAVRYVEGDEAEVRALLVPDDPLYATNQTDLKPATTNVEAAWDHGFGATATKLCIVDTGQQRLQEDLSGLSYYLWADLVRNRATPYDDNGHGTHVTGTAAALANNGKGIAGIAPGVSLGAVKVLDKNGSGTWSRVASGITRCVDAGSHIVSLSLGGRISSQVVGDAVSYALGKGVLVVAAAGNSGPCSDCVSFPARLDGVTAVGCTDMANQPCSFSARGPQIDLVAPGKNITSTWSGASPCRGNQITCYVRISGTSMSTPHVSGVAALYKSAHPSADGPAIEAALKAGAKDLGLAATTQGAGLLQGDVV